MQIVMSIDDIVLCCYEHFMFILKIATQAVQISSERICDKCFVYGYVILRMCSHLKDTSQHDIFNISKKIHGIRRVLEFSKVITWLFSNNLKMPGRRRR